jgi:aldose 1-epimerase
VKITRKIFGTAPDGEEVYLYTLMNNQGVEVSITNYGGAVTSIRVPDRNGDFGDVVLGYETLDEYVRNPRYLGALIGRCANRIGRGKISLSGVEYQLAQNNGPNHLHGGVKGFDKRVWKAKEREGGLGLEYFSEDGEEHYPGNLKVGVSYALVDNELRIDYEANTDKDTIVNLTNHSYFNLAGNGNILGHELMLKADSFTPVSKDLIPTGEIHSVENTAMDFRANSVIGSGIKELYEQLSFTGGYDHNFVLNDFDGSLRLIARVREPTSGRVMEVLTTQPGVQFYSGNFLDGSLTGKGGAVYHKHAGFCLETQHFPDSPNHPNFPATVLRPGDDYRHTTVYSFKIE